MSSPSKATFVFVPGAWHTPAAFQEVVSQLAQKGHSSALVSLASVGADPPLHGFEEDVEVIERTVKELVDTGTDVVLVMHSYGGLPGSQAMGAFMDADDNKNEERRGKGRVRRMVWLCAFVPSEGGSLFKAVHEKDMSWWNVEGLIVNPKDPTYRFYADLPPATAAAWVSELRPHSYRCFHSVVTVEPWLKIPSSYLICENDMAIPLQAQDAMVAYAKEKSEGKAFDHVDRCGSGHSPFLSMPELVVGFLERAAAGGGKA